MGDICKVFLLEMRVGKSLSLKRSNRFLSSGSFHVRNVQLLPHSCRLSWVLWFKHSQPLMLPAKGQTSVFADPRFWAMVLVAVRCRSSSSRCCSVGSSAVLSTGAAPQPQRSSSHHWQKGPCSTLLKFCWNKESRRNSLRKKKIWVSFFFFSARFWRWPIQCVSSGKLFCQRNPRELHFCRLKVIHWISLWPV